MNAQTKKALKELCDQVKLLSTGVVLITGNDTCTQVIDAADNLKYALDHDETILEPR